MWFMPRSWWVPPCLMLGLLGMAGGCASAVQAGASTALDGVDLVRMTEDMAMKIAADPQVQEEFRHKGPLVVVVRPVRNQMTAEVLPRGASEAFTGRVRTLLSRHAPHQFIWVMNRDAYYQLRQRELAGVEIGPNPEAVSPQYALTATFRNLIHEDPRRRSSHYLCVYQLTDLSERNILWTDAYELKKVAVKGFLD